MAENSFAYIPASQGIYQLPLGRFLPGLPKGVIATWVRENIQPGSLVLDPLGAHPLLPIEGAESGARMLVARNNPILWLLLETIAATPTSEQLLKILTKLLIVRRGPETIEDHLRSIYATPCSGCGQMVQPVGFIWEKGNQLPSSRVYSCPACGDEGEREISEHDLQNLSRLGNLGLHRSRAFQRVLQGGEYEQESIESALDCYLPRALYVCMTLVNQLERLDLSKEDRQLLQSMLLLVFDDANSLWHWPSRDQRYFQLSVPSRFLEKNLWLSLESSPQRWNCSHASIPVSYWPDLPEDSGGICLYQRRSAEKENLFQGGQPRAIATIFPRPNQAFWTLSAMWSGWLWGRNAVTPMRSALARRRYDWRWFAQALEAALKDLSKVILPGVEMFGLLSQAAPNHLLGLLAGANASGFRLQGYAACPSEEITQCLWQAESAPDSTQKVPLQKIIREYLETRGEPRAFQAIINECLTQIAMQGDLPSDIGGMDETYFSQIQHQVSDILHDEHFAQAYQSSPTSSSRWWPVNSRRASTPIPERLEQEIRKILLEQTTISVMDLERLVFQKLTGASTPEKEDLLICLESYADEKEDQSGIYTLKEEESEAARQKDIEDVIALLEKQGKNFGFKPQVDGQTVRWENKERKCLYEFFIHISCDISGHLLSEALAPACQHVLVYPGSRSRWLYHRLQQDARLETAINGSWHLLKFRYLRWLAAREESNIKIWDELLDGDPPLWEASTQIQLF